MQSAAELIDAWVAMWNSYDLNEVSRLFARDDRLTYLSSEKEGVVQGFETIVEHHRGFGFVQGGKSTGNKLWLDRLAYSNFGETTVVAGTWYFQRAGSAESAAQRGPVTFVCVAGGSGGDGDEDDGRGSGGGYLLAHLNFGNYPARK
jgi:hypothetical protein